MLADTSNENDQDLIGYSLGPENRSFFDEKSDSSGVEDVVVNVIWVQKKRKNRILAMKSGPHGQAVQKLAKRNGYVPARVANLL